MSLLSAGDGFSADYFENESDTLISHGGVEFNLESLECSETDRTNEILLESEFQPYMMHYDFNEEYNMKKSHPLDGPRYFSAGYEANVDPPDPLEISRWQRAFSFLHIIGEGLENSLIQQNFYQDQGCDCNSPPEATYVFDSIANRSDNIHLSIIGRKMNIQRVVMNEYEIIDIPEEIIEQDGELEEVFDIDITDVMKVDNGDESVAEQNRSDALDLWIQLAWREVVPSLLPLIQRIVEKEKELNLPKSIIERQSMLRQYFVNKDDEGVEQDQGENMW